MDDNTIRKNFQTSIVLFVLCVAVAVAAALLRWTEIAVGMGAMAVLQAYFVYVWWHRKRRRKVHFRRKPQKRP